MLKMPDTTARFFSVTHSTKIQGERYIPSVCYPLSSGVQAAVEEMTTKGMARIYTEKVRFVTGIPFPVKKVEAAAPRPSSAPAPETGGAVKPPVKRNPSAPGKPGRRSGRSAFTAQTSRDFE
jgi:hypothetical protein